MSRAEIRTIVQSIFVEHFNIAAATIIWNDTLEKLNDNFRFLGFLLELEQLLNTRFNTKILLVEHISAIIHTPEDIITLIYETIQISKE